MDAWRVGIGVWMLAVSAASLVHAGSGLAHSKNFIVLSSDKELASAVLEKAEELRKSLAEEWLGAELPPSAGRVTIHAELTAQQDRGRTYVDSTDNREYHVVWLNTSRDRATGSTLAHEMTHVVFASRFRGQLPAWADEGAASLRDDEARHELRRRALQNMAQSGSWPNLIAVLEQPSIDVADQRAYSVAVSLTEFLLSRGEKPRFLEFAAAGKERGWNAALAEFYQLRSVGDLQTAWQDWVRTSLRAPVSGRASR